MKYGIVGSRRRKDKESIEKFVAGLNPDDIVISGGCRGVDTWAVDAAKKRCLKTIEHLPDKSHCKTRLEFTEAYYARNEKIAADCDILVAFVSADRKGGTENTIKHAKKFGKEIVIIPPP